MRKAPGTGSDAVRAAVRSDLAGCTPVGNRIAVASDLGKGDASDRAIADFSPAYADQNERDYAAFAAAVDSGRLTALTGV